MLGQSCFDLVLAWREFEAELIIARWHELARNPWAAGIEPYTAGNKASRYYAHKSAGIKAAKYDSANYRPRTASTLGCRPSRGCGARAPRREPGDHNRTYDDT